MIPSGNVFEFEGKGKDGGDPAVHRSVRNDVRIVDHTFDIFCVDLDSEIASSDEPKLRGLECPEESVELDFGLGVARFSVVPSDRPETGRIAFVVGAHLGENESDGYGGGVDGQDDFAIG